MSKLIPSCLWWITNMHVLASDLTPCSKYRGKLCAHLTVYMGSANMDQLVDMITRWLDTSIITIWVFHRSYRIHRSFHTNGHQHLWACLRCLPQHHRSPLISLGKMKLQRKRATTRLQKSEKCSPTHWISTTLLTWIYGTSRGWISVKWHNVQFFSFILFCLI